MKHKFVLATAVAVILLAAAAAAGLNAVFSVTAVRVEVTAFSSAAKQDALALQEDVNAFVGASTVFLDTEEVRAAAERYPYFCVEAVEKQYPQPVVLTVREREERFAVPLVIVDRDVPKGSTEVYSVRSDEPQAMELAVGLLADRGCRRVGSIIYGQSGTGNTEIRKNGILKALKRHGLPVAEQLIRFSTEDGYVEEIGRLLQNGVDALFCPGGNAGMVAAYALSLYNRRVPADISMIASERTVFSRYATPPQTTISQNYAAQASAVADALDASRVGFPTTAFF